MIDP
jgi:hypothetical protein